MYQKNRLKDLIYIQDNKPCNEQTVNGLFRAILEPVLKADTESLILCRLEEKSKNAFNGILKRLEYSGTKFYDFSDIPIKSNFTNVLKEKIWDKTEFIYVTAQRYGAVLIFDYEESNINETAQIYVLYNSSNLLKAFEIINANSTVDLKEYQRILTPDRRDNNLLNESLRKVVENLNETNDEILISRIEKDTALDNTDLEGRLEFLSAKSSYIAHEMRNLLSICNLYSEIIDKQSHNIKFEDEQTKKSVFNARDCIQKSITMAGNLLLDFKSMGGINLKEYDLKNIVKTAIELARIYANSKNIQFKSEIEEGTNILADETKLLTVFINLIKNAVESIAEKGEIIISSKNEGENIKVIISNNGNPISEETKAHIFEEGFTTKPTGTGLGLVICKKTLEEQFSQLKLLKSDNASTEFEISLLKG